MLQTHTDAVNTTFHHCYVSVKLNLFCFMPVYCVYLFIVHM